MTRNAYEDIGKTAANLIRSRIDTVEVLLDADEPFCVWDVDLTQSAFQGTVRYLERQSALEHVGRREKRVSLKHDAGGTTLKTAKTYSWTAEARAIAESEREDIDRLPCGHRWHILNTENGFDCKHCDTDHNWSRETIKEAKS